MAQKATKLQARIKEIQDSLQCPCPSKYGLKRYIRVDGRETVVDGESVQDSDRLNILRKRRVDKGIFTPEEDLEEAIRTARYDSFIMGPEMVARHRLAELRKKKRAANGGWGSPFTPTQQAEFRLLRLLYPGPPNPEPDESTLADHPFQDLPSPKAPQRPASTSAQPDPDEDFVEFAFVPPHCRVNPNYPQEGERLIWSWWNPGSPRR
jgi:hypothetical protein